MVNLREIDRQFRPSDRQPGINNEGRGGIEQFFRDAGAAYDVCTGPVFGCGAAHILSLGVRQCVLYNYLIK